MGSVRSDRIQPHSEDAEKGVLGSMLQSLDAIAEAHSTINAGFFFLPTHQTIYSELIASWHKNEPTDLILFTQKLRNKNLLDTVGGVAYISGIYTFPPTSANVTYYIEILREKYLLRQLIHAGTEIVNRSFEEQENVNQLLVESREKICEIQREPSRMKRRSARDLVDSVIHRLENPTTSLGIGTGIKKLDDVIGGLAEGSNVVVSAKTSTGKSAFAQLLANHIAVDKKIPVVIFSFEMTDEQTMQRILQIRSEVSAGRIARREAEMFEMSKFTDAAGEVSQSPLHIISDRLDVAGMRARVLQIRPRVVIIDYFQIIPEKQLKGESRTERFDRMSAEIKQMAIQLCLTTVVLSQLNEKETTYGSSMFTNDADVLLVIESVGEHDPAKAVEDKVIKVAKQREGPRPTIHLSFVKGITKFKERKS